MLTVTYLQSNAFNQMQAHLKNFLKISHVKQKDIINKIFDKFSKLKKHIRIVFRDINIEYTVKEKLIYLQQRELVTSYAAKFQKIISYTN